MKEDKIVLKEIRKVINKIDKEKSNKFVEEIALSKKINVIGSGRSEFIGKCFLMRLGHLGLNISDGNNGLLIVLSGSGKTKETLNKLKNFKGKIVCLTMDKNSPIAKKSYLVVEVKAKNSRQPLRSLFEQACLIYLDSLVMVLMKKLKVSEKEMWKRHK